MADRFDSCSALQVIMKQLCLTLNSDFLLSCRPPALRPRLSSSFASTRENWAWTISRLW